MPPRVEVLIDADMPHQADLFADEQTAVLADEIAWLMAGYPTDRLRPVP